MPQRRSGGATRRRSVDELIAPVSGLLDEVVSTSVTDAGVEPSTLRNYLAAVMTAAHDGERLTPEELEACRVHGGGAAERGEALSALLDLYLSASWRMWGEIEHRAARSTPEVVASVATIVLRAADDAAAALADGYEQAQRQTVRFEESLRREFVDDLLSGVAEPGHLHERAGRFGVNLAGSHVVVVARTDRRLVDAGPVHGRVETQVLATFGGRDVVVATKDGLLVCVFPSSAATAAEDLAATLREGDGGDWQLAVGRAGIGAGGLVQSFTEARQALELGGDGAAPGSIHRFENLLAPRVLTSNRALAAELVEAVLGPLSGARGGALPLIETIEAHLEAGGNLTAAARALHLSPRAVGYRIDRIRSLTSHDLNDADGRFTLELAIRARRILQPAGGDQPANGSG